LSPPGGAQAPDVIALRAIRAATRAAPTVFTHSQIAIEGRDEGFSFSCRLYHVNGKSTVAPSKEAIIAKLESLMR
jgi:hypothetical protein